jgi:hypothetical protein
MFKIFGGGVYTHTPWWGLPFLFFEYLLFALLGPGPARATHAKSAIMATRRMTSFILMVDTVEMLGWKVASVRRVGPTSHNMVKSETIVGCWLSFLNKASFFL